MLPTKLQSLISRHGRHFADDVRTHLYAGQPLAAAISAATQSWMGWAINRNTSRATGIPRGLPYLTGFVIHCAILTDDAS